MNNPTPRMPIPLPYNLKHDEVKITEQDVEDFTDEPDQSFGDAAFGYIADNLSWSDDETMERIFRAAICLYHQPHSDALFGKCLAQAIIWEVG